MPKRSLPLNSFPRLSVDDVQVFTGLSQFNYCLKTAKILHSVFEGIVVLEAYDSFRFEGLLDVQDFFYIRNILINLLL